MYVLPTFEKSFLYATQVSSLHQTRSTIIPNYYNLLHATFQSFQPFTHTGAFNVLHMLSHQIFTKTPQVKVHPNHMQRILLLRTQQTSLLS